MNCEITDKCPRSATTSFGGLRGCLQCANDMRRDPVVVAEMTRLRAGSDVAIADATAESGTKVIEELEAKEDHFNNKSRQQRQRKVIEAPLPPQVREIAEIKVRPLVPQSHKQTPTVGAPRRAAQPRGSSVAVQMIALVAERPGISRADAEIALGCKHGTFKDIVSILRRAGKIDPQYAGYRGVLYPVGGTPTEAEKAPVKRQRVPRAMVVRAAVIPGVCRIEGCCSVAEDRGLCTKCKSLARKRGITEMVGAPVASRSKPNQTRSKVEAFIQANPGTNGAAIVAHFGLTRPQVDAAVEGLRRFGRVAPGESYNSANRGKLYATTAEVGPELSATKVQDYLRRRGGWVLVREVAQYFGCSLESAGSMLGTLAAIGEVRQDSRGFHAVPARGKP